jgi:DcmR-like sensory protein
MNPTTDMFWGEIAPCEHLLQIYDNDAVLLDALAGFVGGGLKAGEATIVIATPAHLHQLEDRLESAGLDLSAALFDDRYIPLDAEQTLERFICNGWPDADLFAEVVTGILRRAKGDGRRVRAFGEMVALLWARNQAAATVRLEHLWNKLCHRDGFSLFCAYPKVGVTRECVESMGEICMAHSRLVGGGAAEALR